MNLELKKKLLKRKFSSVDYMKEMEAWHGGAIDSLVGAINEFYARSSEHEDWHQWPKSDWPETWEERVFKNLVDTQSAINMAIIRAQEGDNSYMEGVSNEVHSIFRNLDNFSWGWWQCVPGYYQERFQSDLARAKKCGSNIMRELMGAWKRGDSILNEEITGPIDEEDLLRYMNPGDEV